MFATSTTSALISSTPGQQHEQHDRGLRADQDRRAAPGRRLEPDRRIELLFEHTLPDDRQADCVLCDRQGRSMAALEAKRARTDPIRAQE